MCNFTKGPWFLDKYGNLIDVSGSSVLIKASISIPMARYTDEQVSNAHLIAAAPEMYDLLNRLEKECEMFYSEFGEPSSGEYEAAFTEIRKLLAKARGEHV